MKCRKPASRPLNLETLEQRTVMAGSIAASVSGGILRLVGDARDNVAVVWKGNNPGEVVVAGAKDYAGGNTLVNGQAQPVTFSGVTQLRVNTGAGNDRVLVTNLALPSLSDPNASSIAGNLGDGNDQLVISGSTSPRNFTLNGGGAIPYGRVTLQENIGVAGNAGNDTLSMLNVTNVGTSRASFFNGGTGNDAVYVDGSLDKNRFGTLFLTMGAGNDTVSLKRAQFALDLLIQDIAPEDNGTTLSKIDIFKAQVNLHLRINVNGSRAQVNLDSDSNPANYLTARQLWIFTDNYQDEISVGHVNIGREGSSFVSYLGNDKLTLTDSVFESLGAELRGGNDEVSVGNVTVTRRARFDGGDGTDTFNDLGGNSFGELEVENFE